MLASGAWITGHHAFSNAALCLNFDLWLNRVPELRSRLAVLQIRLTPESEGVIDALERRLETGDPSVHQQELSGTFQITFVHSEADLRTPIPPIPG